MQESGREEEKQWSRPEQHQWRLVLFHLEAPSVINVYIYIYIDIAETH